MRCGVPQGSILGPLSLNIYFFLHGNMFLNVDLKNFKPALIFSYPYLLKAPL